jgi:hypothetical protein
MKNVPDRNAAPKWGIGFTDVGSTVRFGLPGSPVILADFVVRKRSSNLEPNAKTGRDVRAPYQVPAT